MDVMSDLSCFPLLQTKLLQKPDIQGFDELAALILKMNEVSHES